MVVFGYLGYYNHLNGTTFEDLPIGGADLIFVTYPAIFSKLPFPNLMMGLFFFAMCLLGISSQFGMVNITSYFIEDLNLKIGKYKIEKTNARLLVCVVTGILGLVMTTRGGFYVFGIIDSFVFRVPGALSNLLNLVIFVKCTKID